MGGKFNMVRAGVVEHPRQWSEALAVGRRSFVERVQPELGVQALRHCVEEVDGASVLRDPAPPYGHHFAVEMVPVPVSSISPSPQSDL